MSERRIRFRAPPCGLHGKKKESGRLNCKCLLTFTHLPKEININKNLRKPLFEFLRLSCLLDKFFWGDVGYLFKSLIKRNPIVEPALKGDIRYGL